MQQVNRLILTAIFAATVSGALPAAPDTTTTAATPAVPAADTDALKVSPTHKKAPKAVAKMVVSAMAPAEYKRTDANFYWKGDVTKVEPNAVILTAGQYTQKADSYFPTALSKKAPKTIYIQVVNDWIEPITPPDMPASLGVPSNAMQIREPQGDVQVAYPSAPTAFLPAKEGMTIPNGTVIKTGGNGSAAVLFGGIASARLVPNSEAAVQQNVTPQVRTTEIDLSKGAVFSKVGQIAGEKEDYKVKTPFGIAAARGTDFVSVALPARMDVWIAQGTVQLESPDGKMVGTVKSDGAGPLKIVRYPLMPDAHQAMMADAETMTAAMNFIPMANMKLKALHDKKAQGIAMTASETDYLGRIKSVPCLIKLALIEPVAPPVLPTVVPAVVPPAPAAPSPAPNTPAPSVKVTAVPLAPIDLDLRPDGKVDFQGSTLSLDELKPAIESLAKDTPGQPILIKGRDKVPHDQVHKVMLICKGAKLKDVKVDKTVPAAPATATLPATTPTMATPAAAPAPSAPPAPAPDAAPAKQMPPVMQLPLNIQLRPDGKVRLDSATLTLNELKVKLEEISLVSPGEPVVLESAKSVSHKQIAKVVALCHSARLKNVTVSPAKSQSDLVAANGSAAPAMESVKIASTTNADYVSPNLASASAASESPAAPALAKDSSANVPIEKGPHDTVP